jgi:hypothetical protein
MFSFLLFAHAVSASMTATTSNTGKVTCFLDMLPRWHPTV